MPIIGFVIVSFRMHYSENWSKMSSGVSFTGQCYHKIGTPMKVISLKYWLLIALAAIIVLGGLTIYLWPEVLPQDECQKIRDEAVSYDVVIIFNPGGWGNAALSESPDFTPILNHIQQTLSNLGYSSVLIPYSRTPAGLSGRISDIKELINSFKYTSQTQDKAIKYLSDSFPNKQFIITGFSNGGGLTSMTIEGVANQPNICSIVAGVPGWYKTYRSENSLVLNNNGKDSLSALDIRAILLAIIKAPFIWLRARVTGQGLSLALAFQFPGHGYSWPSPEVGPPIIKFLESKFKARTVKINFFQA